MRCVYTDFEQVGIEEARHLYNLNRYFADKVLEDGYFILSTCLRFEIYYESKCSDIITQNVSHFHVPVKHIHDSDQTYQRLVMLSIGLLSQLKFEQAISDQLFRAFQHLDKDSELYRFTESALTQGRHLRENLGLRSLHDYCDIAFDLVKNYSDSLCFLIFGGGLLAQSISKRLLLSSDAITVILATTKPSTLLHNLHTRCSVITIDNLQSFHLNTTYNLIIANNLLSSRYRKLCSELITDPCCAITVDFSSNPLFNRDGQAYFNMQGTDRKHYKPLIGLVRVVDMFNWYMEM